MRELNVCPGLKPDSQILTWRFQGGRDCLDGPLSSLGVGLPQTYISPHTQPTSGLVAFATMVGSWVCRQLLFGWLLLVGSSGQDLSSEEEEEATPVEVPDEELEQIVRGELASLQDMRDDQKQEFQDLALAWYNYEHSSLVKPLGAANVTVKKAIGSMMYMQLFLEETNCTAEAVRNYTANVEHSYSGDVDPPALIYCGPLAERMQQNCTFAMFQDERSYAEAVVDHKCQPLGFFDFPEMSLPYNFH